MSCYQRSGGRESLVTSCHLYVLEHELKDSLTIVVRSLVSAENERVTLSGVDLNLIDNEGLHVHAFHFDDGHLVAVN